MTSYLTPAELASALAVPDLTDPAHGPHAMASCSTSWCAPRGAPGRPRW